MFKTLTLWSALLISSSLGAQVHGRYQQASSSGVDSYGLTDGKTVTGQVLGIDGNEVRMKVYFGAGTMSRKYKLGEFNPRSGYRIRRAAVSATDADAQLGLARYAVENGLISEARDSLDAARKAAGNDSIGADVAKALVAAPAKRLQAQFAEQLERGDLRAAERALSTLRAKHTDVVTAEQLAAMGQQLEKRRGERESEIVAAKAARADARVVADRERKLSPLHKRLEAARTARQRGLESSKHFSKANGQFKKAVGDCDYVLRGAARLDKSHGNDPVMVRELSLLQKQANEVKIASLLSGASLYTTRGTFTDAMGNVNKVLAIEPGNQQALAMRGRIELASNRGVGWGW